MIYFTLILSLYITSLSTAAVAKPLLHILVLVPLPDEDYQPIFDQGYSIIPAVQLAVEQINNRTDILPHLDVNVLVVDSGCDKTSKTALNLVKVLRNQLVSRNGPLAAIGPSCSEDSVFVGNIFNNFLYLPVLYSGTSVNVDKRRNMFGMISSVDVLLDALISVAKEEMWNWENIAVFYDDSREHFQHMYAAFLRLLDASQQIGYTRRIISSQIPLNEVIRKNIRIVVLFIDKKLAQQIVCLAGQSSFNFIFPIHQFVFIERSLRDFTEVYGRGFSFVEQNDAQMYHCNNDTLIRGLNGSIFINQALDSVNPNSVSASGLTVGEVKAQYREKLAEYGERVNMSLLETHYAYAYYDGMYAAAIGLHRTFATFHPSFDLLYENIRNVSFQGVSGWIHFGQRHYVLYGVDVHQVNGLEVIKKGSWNGSKPQYTSDTFISDRFENKTVVLYHLLVALGLLVTIALVATTVILQVMTIVYRNYSSVKASSVQLNHFIYLGCYLYAVAIFSSTLRQIVPSVNGDILCNFDIFGCILASCFITSTVLVKSWRTYRIFNHVFKTARAHRYSLHTITLSTAILSLTVIQVILCVPVMVVSPFEELKSFVLDKSVWPPAKKVQSECVTESIAYIAFPLLFQFFVAIATVFLATLNRNVKRKHFRTTKQIFILVYILTILWAIGGPLLAISNYLKFSVNITYSLYLCLISITVILNQVLLITPSLAPIFTGSRANAFSLYMQSLRRSILL